MGFECYRWTTARGFGHKKIACLAWLPSAIRGSRHDLISCRNSLFYSDAELYPKIQLQLQIRTKPLEGKGLDAAKIVVVFRKATTIDNGFANTNGRRHACKGISFSPF
jgi:hypothetical protein